MKNGLRSCWLGWSICEEQQAALASLVELVNQRSATIWVENGALVVEGVAINRDAAFLPGLVSQLKAHGVGEVVFAYRTPPTDLLHLLHGLALEAPADGAFDYLERRLIDAQAVTIRVLSPDAHHAAEGRRGATIPEAMGATAAAAPGPEEQGAAGSSPIVSSEDADLLVEQAREATTSLAAAVKRVRRHPAGAELSRVLNAVAEGVVTAVRSNRTDEAIEAVIAVVQQEEEAPTEDVRICYSATLQRILQREVLEPLSKLLIDPLYGKDVTEIMKRAGTKATEMLLDLLVAADTFAERRSYMGTIRQMERGTDILVSMLNHHEWYVVRNVSDLVGDLRIEEGIPALGRATEHEDPRVRRSVGVALGKIGTAASVKFLTPLLRDSDPQVRAEVARGLSGKDLTALAMPLVNAVGEEEDEAVRDELYRALGRIGTASAVQALINAAWPGGLLLQAPGRDRPACSSRGAGTCGW